VGSPSFRRRWRVFFRLIFPLSVPVIASLVIFQFLWVWNDLLVALIYVGGTPAVAPMTRELMEPLTKAPRNSST